MKTNIGYRVKITSPIKKTYEIETNNKHLAIGLALDMAKNRYPCNNWSIENVDYTTEEYKYKSIKFKASDFK